MAGRFLLPFLFFVVLTLAVQVHDANAQGRVFWRGMVDDKVQLVLKNDHIETLVISGKANPDGVYSFTMPLPETPISVEVTRVKGRGKVRVVQQPSEDNDFSAIVEILDDKGGAREYQLEIFWK